MTLHEQCVGATDEWYTPPHVFDALGCQFGDDVASPGQPVTPWIPATRFITTNSLGVRWEGFVWMNPPFGGRNALAPWLQKFFSYGDGIALVPDRTSAPWWQKFAPKADLILFVAPKLKFIGADGKPGKSPAQGTCLLAKGMHGTAASGTLPRCVDGANPMRVAIGAVVGAVIVIAGLMIWWPNEPHPWMVIPIALGAIIGGALAA